VITSPSDRPLYKRIADELREQIAAGQYRQAGLPAEKDLQHVYGASNRTIRAALAELVRDGLVVKQGGTRTRVRETPIMARIRVDLEGREIGGRGATEAEAAEYRVPVGAPMLTLYDVRELPDGSVEAVEVEAWPADRTRLRRQP